MPEGPLRASRKSDQTEPTSRPTMHLKLCRTVTRAWGWRGGSLGSGFDPQTMDVHSERLLSDKVVKQ